MKKNKHVGSNFDDFLQEEGMLEEIEEVVAKRIFVFQVEDRLDAMTRYLDPNY